ncbi:hypothetical protein LCGC14_1685040 [marine sediment metagenome]|uniref:Uncharacterized protein n=1 Tax=marine sediment metagenome TaxID=412755 RepID=A0A0F9IA18_9ZZZZ
MKGLGWLLAFFIALIAVGAFTLGFSVVSILLAVTGLAALAFWALFRRW